jgi:hypothetical protein
MRHAQPVLSHVLDMGGPGIDEGDVLAGLHHMRTGISADRTGPDDGDFLLAHASSRTLACQNSSTGAAVSRMRCGVSASARNAEPLIRDFSRHRLCNG